MLKLASKRGEGQEGGERQKGRIQPKSVINCKPKKNDIVAAIKKLTSNSFQKKLSVIKNPYYKKGTENKIFNTIKGINLKKLKNKTFFDYN